MACKSELVLQLHALSFELLHLLLLSYYEAYLCASLSTELGIRKITATHFESRVLIVLVFELVEFGQSSFVFNLNSFQLFVVNFMLFMFAPQSSDVLIK